MTKLFDVSLFGAEARAERLRMFRLLVRGIMLAGTAVLTTIAVLDERLRGLAVVSLVWVAGVGTAALVLSRGGRLRAASWVLLLGLVVVITRNAWLGGGMASPGVSALLVLPILAGLLLGGRAAVVTTGVCGVVVATLAAAETAQLLPAPTVHYGPLSRVLLFAYYLSLVMVMARLTAGAVLKLVARLRSELAERQVAEERLELALNAASIGVWDHDPSTGATRVDPRVQRIFGVPPTEDPVITLDLDRTWSAVHPDDRAVVAQTMHRMATSADPVHLEYRAFRADGAVRMIHADAAGVAAPDRPHRVVGILRDVTEAAEAQQERERLLQELSRLEAVLRAVLDSSNDLVWAVDAREFRVIALNGKSKEHFARNYGIQQVMGMPAVEIFPPGEYRETWSTLFERALRQGSFVVEEYRTARGDLLLELHVGLLEREGEIFGISVYGRNITERRAAEAEIRRSEARFRAIFDASPNGVAISRGGKLVMGNPCFARMFGYRDQADLAGLAIPDCFAPESARVMMARQQARFAGEKVPAAYEVAGLRADGSTFPAYMQLIVMELPDGPAVLAFFQDLTEIRRAEEEQARVEAQLRHAQQMEAIGTLAAGFAHDFNNVLAPMVGAAEMALDEVGEDSPLHEDLAVIEAGGRRARALVRQILLLSRAEEESEREPIQPMRLVQESVRLLRAGLPTTIDIETELPATCPPVLGNPTQLQQVLLNLCTNARDAMAGVGTLKVAVRELGPEGAAPAAGDPDASWVVLSVSDTGCGMSPEVQRRIFEPYYTTKARGKGTGLGLSVTNGIVAALGGQIRVQSAPGAGSTFEVLLPACAAAEGVDPIVRQPPRGQGERVLVVDDEPAFRAVMVRMLTGLGYTPAALEDPEAVLALIRSAPDALDAMVVDQTMPRMTGTELSRECLTLRPDLPIILCTGDAKTAGAREAGIRQVLHKPFRMAAIAEALRSVLTGERSAAD